jgi:hypothetical protein
MASVVIIFLFLKFYLKIRYIIQCMQNLFHPVQSDMQHMLFLFNGIFFQYTRTATTVSESHYGTVEAQYNIVTGNKIAIVIR